MTLLDRYLAKIILSGAFLALALLLALDLLFALIKELDDVGEGIYRYQDMFLYLLLTVPYRAYELFPAGVLVGGLLSLGAVANNSELIVMRAAGISVWRLVGSVLQTGLILGLLVAVLGELVIPYAEQAAQNLQLRKQGLTVSQSFSSGLWLRDENRFIYLGKVYPNWHLEDVYIDEYDQQLRLRSTTYAHTMLPAGDNWELREVKRTVFNAAYEVIGQESHAVEFQPVKLSTSTLKNLQIEADILSIRQLYHYIEYLEANQLDAESYRLAFWLKISQPITCIIVLLMVLPFIFGSLRSVTSGQLLIIGIIIGLVFYIFMRIAAYLGQIYNIPPFISAALPILLAASIAVFNLARTR